MNTLQNRHDLTDEQWLKIEPIIRERLDGSHCKVHPHAAGAVGGNQDMERIKGGLTPRFTLRWMRMVCQSDLLLQKVQLMIAKRLSSL